MRVRRVPAEEGGTVNSSTIWGGSHPLELQGGEPARSSTHCANCRVQGWRHLHRHSLRRARQGKLQLLWHVQAHLRVP